MRDKIELYLGMALLIWPMLGYAFGVMTMNMDSPGFVIEAIGFIWVVGWVGIFIAINIVGR